MTETVKPLNPIKRFIMLLSIVLLLAGSVWLIWIEENRVVPIIMYHHIDELDAHAVATIPPDVFEEHLKYLTKHRFEVLSLDDLIEAKNNGVELSRKTVILTFDDGYLDNYTNAYPLLKKYGFTATMYISSDKVGQPGYMNWDQLKELNENGFEIGSHSRLHNHLPDVSPEEWVNEIQQSRVILQKNLAAAINHFSYPVGGFNEKIKHIVKSSGYTSAVTTNRGFDRYNKDVYELNRVTIDEEDNFGAIRWAKFSGYYNLFRKPRNPY